MLALAGLVDVPYDPLLILGAFGLLVLLAFTVTAFGVLVAVTIKQAQTFTWVMQLVVFPMVFLSGALYPVAGLPAWLEVLNRINPLTYAVDPMRHLVFNHLDVSESARQTLDPGVTWFGWHLPPLFEVAMVLVLGLAMLGARDRAVLADRVADMERAFSTPAKAADAAAVTEVVGALESSLYGRRRSPRPIWRASGRSSMSSGTRASSERATASSATAWCASGVSAAKSRRTSTPTRTGAESDG